MATLDLWGGIECTVNRVGNSWFDQLERSGHARRCDDLDRIADLGIRTLRYPVLWERTAPQSPDRFDWRWPDERLNRLRDLGIKPIVGLVHHGSGPAYTNLLDEGFATGLAGFARQVAQRYPWIDAYTPVNEPLTTARFSALYGTWYPHRHDDVSFVQALLVECRAVILAMQAIRAINPVARLVQTDDLGTTYSTGAMKHQADFDNERRWLGWDLVAGQVDARHPLREFLRNAGATAADLDWFVDNGSTPDVIGINHYLTSDRFLDERLQRYQQRAWGSNGREQYADVEAVRVLSSVPHGPRELLRAAAQRYRTSVAITEVHLGCSREEQLRWLADAWEAARRSRAEGIDVIAVTAWSLFGAYDWNTLLTGNTDHYEPGAFDTRSTVPRATALAGLVRELASGRRGSHCVLRSPGWWRRPERVLYPPETAVTSGREPRTKTRHRDVRPVLITGGNGTLGRAFGRLCAIRGLEYRALTRYDLDICDAAGLDAWIAQIRPWCIVNAAGYVRVDDAEGDPGRCYLENSVGPLKLAAVASRRGLPFATFSSDLVFDGRSSSAYTESSPPSPLSVYGRSKLDAEIGVRKLHPDALVVRTSAFFGPWDPHNFLTLALSALADGRTVAAADDVQVSPTYLPDLVNACLDLLIDGETGLWHLANAGAVTWAEFARRGALCADLDPSGIQSRSSTSLGWLARRPACSALTSERGLLLPPLDDALARYVVQMGDAFTRIRSREETRASDFMRRPASDASMPGNRGPQASA